MFPCKWSLFHLYHFSRLQHFKAVAAGGKQDDISCRKDSGVDNLPVVVVKVDLDLPLPDKKDFLRIKDLTLELVMDVRGYDISGRTVHVRQLLREIVRGKELDPVPAKISADNYRKKLIAV